MTEVIDNPRIVTLDVIRGIAVMGIFSVNVIAFAMIEAAYFNPHAYGGHEGIDLILWAANMLLVDGKMRALFSMLFGASMLLVVDRAVRGGAHGWPVHARRMLVLLGFGLAHYFLLWFGDILHLYALSGLILYLFRNRSVRGLIGWGVGFSILSALMMSAFALYLRSADLAAHAPGASAEAIAAWAETGGYFSPSAAEIARDSARILGPWSGLVASQFRDAETLISNIILTLPETLGLMLFGMAAYRSGLFTGGWDRARYRRLAIGGIAIGLVGHALLIAAELKTGFYGPVIMGGFFAAMSPFRIVQALGYAALIILLARSGGWLTERIAAVGRCAFTNYLGTSILAAMIFYGWGFDLYTRLSRAEAWLVAPALWLVMLAWSKPWLDHFCFGPFEWLWRSLARWELQPMRRQTAKLAGAIA